MFVYTIIRRGGRHEQKIFAYKNSGTTGRKEDK
jgi:hypothetical protein